VHWKKMMRIGIDLDNTIINYDNAFLTAAKLRGIINEQFTGGKQALRDHIRTLPDGETEWQKLQGYVYGKGINAATLFDGVEQFVTQAHNKGHELFIVSHKTLYGHFDADKINLRDAAIAFLAAKQFPIIRKQIHFESTRFEKVRTIAKLELNCFIDDLVEVFEEAHFPPLCERVLFHASQTAAPNGDWVAYSSWDMIERAILA
jgi:hypothetical protein